MAKTKKQQLGEWGENQASLFLQRQGYEIICQNYRYKKNEIDIIAKDVDKVLCFVEVKTRVFRSWQEREDVDSQAQEIDFDGSAERANDYKKQLLIKNVAINYCLENNIDIDNTPMKLEHISVYVNSDKKTANIRKFVLSVDKR